MILLSHRSELYKLLPPGIVAEIGVQNGDNAQRILENCRPKQLYLIDCWERQGDGVYASDPTNNETLEQSYEAVQARFAGDARVAILKAYSSEAAELFVNGYFDWVYIDADHTLEAVRRDLRLWWPKVKVGGFLSGHDYITDNWCKKYPYIQVKQAVDEFGVPLYALTDEKYGSWVIRREA